MKLVHPKCTVSFSILNSLLIVYLHSTSVNCVGLIETVVSNSSYDNSTYRSSKLFGRNGDQDFIKSIEVEVNNNLLNEITRKLENSKGNEDHFSPARSKRPLAEQTSLPFYGAIVISFFIIQAIILYSFGQPPISKSGQIKRWDGDVFSAENSQHLTDWYTFTHILHGLIFYSVAGYIFPQTDIKTRFLLALGTEVVWEVVENSPTIIERYRRLALAQGYTGDSIVNSVFDTFAMSLGFFMAHNLPLGAAIGIALAEEIIVGYVIRDNLMLNVIQLIHPFEFISKWQAQRSR